MTGTELGVPGERPSLVEGRSVVVGLGREAVGVAGVVDPVVSELLVQGVSVDPQAGGGLDLDSLAGDQNLLDQLALDEANDPVVEVVGLGAGGADAGADEFGGQGG